MTATLDLMSTGFICGTLQHSPQEIVKAAQTLGIVPAAKINGVVHFNAEQVGLLAEYFRNKKGSKK